MSTEANLYDFPEFYDLIFRDDTKVEADFIEAAWKSYGNGKLTHLLEPACGSGRLVREFAKRGYDVCGFDLNQQAIAYLRDCISRDQLSASAEIADMTRFDLGRRFDLAFCTVNTFRFLTCDAMATLHLQHVADHLHPGGLYVLGFHLLPPHAAQQCVERSRVEDRGIQVDFELKVLDFSRVTRIENVRLTMDVTGADVPIHVASEHGMRIYQATQFEQLLEQVPDFELVEIHDFDFDIDFPRDLDDDLDDAVFVLRKEA